MGLVTATQGAAEGAMWPGDGAVTQSWNGPSYRFLLGRGLHVPELLEKKAGPL